MARSIDTAVTSTRFSSWATCGTVGFFPVLG